MDEGSVVALGIVCLTIALLGASFDGASRADTMRECYKAAQVNTNIKCE